LAKRSQLSFAVHLLGRLGNRGHDAADPRRLDRLVGHRAVRNLEMRLLDESLAIDEQEEVVAGARPSAEERRLDHGADDLPDLVPGFGRRVCRGRWMVEARDGAIRIVVELYELGTPPEQDGEVIAEQKADRRAERL